MDYLSILVKVTPLLLVQRSLFLTNLSESSLVWCSFFLPINFTRATTYCITYHLDKHNVNLSLLAISCFPACLEWYLFYSCFTKEQVFVDYINNLASFILSFVTGNPCIWFMGDAVSPYQLILGSIILSFLSFVLLSEILVLFWS